MRQRPEMKAIQERMKPGILTAAGFLGSDTRNLADIIRHDKELVLRLGLSNEIIAERMQYFTSKAMSYLGSPVIVDDNFEVTVKEHRGIIPCPFGDNHLSDKRNTFLFNKILYKKIFWSDLSMHLIKEHGFYEGKGAFYRLDPHELAVILGIC